MQQNSHKQLIPSDTYQLNNNLTSSNVVSEVINSRLPQNRISVKKNQILHEMLCKVMVGAPWDTAGNCCVWFPLSVGLQHPPYRSVYWPQGTRQGNILPRWHDRDRLIRRPHEHWVHPSALWSVSMAPSVKITLSKISVTEHCGWGSHNQITGKDTCSTY